MTTFTPTKHLTNWKGFFQTVVRTFLINDFSTKSLDPQTLHAREKKFSRQITAWKVSVF